MLLPWTLAWLILGAWNAIGGLLVFGRARNPGTGWRVS